MKQKILVSTSTFPRWQGDTDPPFILFLCQGLSRYFEVHVLAPHCPGSATEETMGELRVHRYRYAPERLEVLAYDGGLLRRIKRQPLYALLLPAFVIGQILTLRRLQKRYQFALLHAHWIIPQGLAAAIGAQRFILTSHGGDLFALKGKFFRALKYRILKRADKITVVSQAMVEECKRLGISQSEVVVQPMGVDTTHLFVPPAKPRARRGLLCVGRLVEKKGISILIEALSILKKKEVEISLIIIGDGPERGALEALVKRNNLELQVSFLGALKNTDLPVYYQQAEIFVLPSVVSRDGDQEGLGLVTVEAMSCACPVIASALPAVKDVVRHGENGLLVEPGSAEVLATAVERMLTDSELKQRLSENALKSARTFDWRHVSERYAQLIETTIRDHGDTD